MDDLFLASAFTEQKTFHFDVEKKERNTIN